MKRRILYFALALVAVLALSACGNKENTKNIDLPDTMTGIWECNTNNQKRSVYIYEQDGNTISFAATAQMTDDDGFAYYIADGLVENITVKGGKASFSFTDTMSAEVSGEFEYFPETHTFILTFDSDEAQFKWGTSEKKYKKMSELTEAFLNWFTPDHFRA